jgi:hypothetical protein
MKVYFETEDGEGFHHCKDACDIDWVGAQDCAEQFYREHDGWESTWPLQFGLSSSPEGPVEKWFSVDVEMAPSFSATEITPSKEFTVKVSVPIEEGPQ